jgi:hypothetical protein
VARSGNGRSRRDQLSRRGFLRAGAAGVATLGVACGADGEPDQATPSDGGAKAGAAGSGGDGGTGGAAASGGSAGSAGSVGSAGSTGSGGGSGDGGVVPPGKATVAIVGATDIESAVRRAIALAGGIDEISAGQTVFIKPNAVHGDVAGMPGVITSFEVLSAVVRVVKERGARVIVGDRSARQAGTSDSVFQSSGLTAAMLARGHRSPDARRDAQLHDRNSRLGLPSNPPRHRARPWSGRPSRGRAALRIGDDRRRARSDLSRDLAAERFQKNAQPSGSAVRTVITGQVACRTTFSATLPIKSADKPVRPCVPITTRS